MKTLEEMKIKNMKINYTDQAFQKFVETKFGVNRGLYNTIDQWFFNYGIENILERRQEVLKFLTFVSADIAYRRNSKLKFGHGGLKVKLVEYSERSL